MNESEYEWMWVDECAWMSEWINKWLNEWVDDCMNEWVNKWTSDWMEWVNEWVSEWMKEWTSEFCKWANRQMSKKYHSFGDTPSRVSFLGLPLVSTPPAASFQNTHPTPTYWVLRSWKGLAAPLSQGPLACTPRAIWGGGSWQKFSRRAAPQTPGQLLWEISQMMVG